jgi:hypothetical protein
MHLLLSIIPDEIIIKYNLQAISVGGWVYLKIRKGVYGLKLYKTRPIAFTLVVDGFALKYVGKEKAHHFRNA